MRTLIDVLVEAMERAPEIRREEIAVQIEHEREPGIPHRGADYTLERWTEKSRYYGETDRLIEAAWAKEGVSP